LSRTKPFDEPHDTTVNFLRSQFVLLSVSKVRDALALLPPFNLALNDLSPMMYTPKKVNP
jgi:hypothetical protein